jgi:hypothetical protein
LNRFFRRPLLAFGLLLAAAAPAPGDPVWYISNAAGMALEEAVSRLALRQKYALSVEEAPPEDLPELLREHLDGGYRIELRSLYEEGALSRRQWIFRDEAGRTRLVAAGSGAFGQVPDAATDAAADITANATEEGEAMAEAMAEATANAAEEAADEAAAEETGEDEAAVGDYAGIIELYDPEGFITEDRRIDSAGAAQITSYRYKDGLLIRGETRRQSTGEADEPVYTDYYRYSRSYSLRGVERVFHGAPRGEEAPGRLRFPPLTLGSKADMDFVSPGSAFGSDFFQDVLMDSGFRVLYTTDERGRILTETRRDEEGEVLGEIRNLWSGDRLSSVSWKAGDEERLTEYEYDDEGDRVLERNYRGGVLERVVRRAGDREIEELYMNGMVILRAIWENGRKLSEERVREARDENG